ncbi:hypothetical protein [Streptomyces canus]|uniref:hypothetical protein n=1 Tax=Streptomyces canus TaxID=58343 RepID=UPI002E28D0D5|nr:hypothetical protein [Streptomyces canus]
MSSAVVGPPARLRSGVVGAGDIQREAPRSKLSLPPAGPGRGGSRAAADATAIAVQDLAAHCAIASANFIQTGTESYRLDHTKAQTERAAAGWPRPPIGTAAAEMSGL